MAEQEPPDGDDSADGDGASAPDRDDRQDARPSPDAKHRAETLDVHTAYRLHRAALGMPSRSPLRRLLGNTGRSLVVALSAFALLFSGIGWVTITTVEHDLSTTNVLDDTDDDTAVEPENATDILLVGNDTRTDAQGRMLPRRVLKQLRTEQASGLNTDTLIVLRVPDNGASATAISIPRDTYVEVPGHGKAKINSAYAKGKVAAKKRLRTAGVSDSEQLERDSDQAGRRLLVRSIQQLTGARIDHYAEVSLYSFYLLTKAVGGVKVCLKNAVDDSGAQAHFPAGVQTVAGSDALSFVRQRKGLPRGDLDRIRRQQVFLAAVANKILSAGTLSDTQRLSQLVDAVQQTVVLDKGWKLLNFAQRMQGIAAGDVAFVTIPVTSINERTAQGRSVVTVNRKEVRSFVTGLNADPSDRPSAPQLPAPSWAPPTSAPGSATQVAPAAAADPPAGADPITAGGVPCVN